MRNFEISEMLMGHLNDVTIRTQKVQATTIVDEYCKCTGFGG